MRHEQKCEASSEDSDPNGDGESSGEDATINQLNELGVDAVAKQFDSVRSDGFGLNKRPDFNVDNP